MSELRQTEHYVQADRERIFHPWYQIGENNGVVLTEGQGIYLKDIDGKEYMDFTSGLVCVNIGHGRQEVVEAAKQQMEKLQYYHIFYGFSNTAIVELAEYLAELVPPGMGHFIFCSGGSEANESSFKVARQYWRNVGQDKYKIIGLEYAYHGLTYGAMSATALNSNLSRRLYAPTVPGFVHVPTYYCYRCRYGLEYPSCNVKCADGLAEAIEREGPETVAAFIGEPVHGSAGMIPPPPEFWPKVRRICSQYDVLLIGDEVMTGFGRTGKLFALQNWGVVPDIMTMGKGIISAYLPFGAVAMSERIVEALKGTGTFPHGYTNMGHPVCAAASLANLKILVGENMVENAAKSGTYLAQRLRELREFDHVGDVTGLGLMCAVELVADKATKARYDLSTGGAGEQVVTQARARGLILRNYMDRLGITPPLPVTFEEIDKAINIMKPIIAALG